MLGVDVVGHSRKPSCDRGVNQSGEVMRVQNVRGERTQRRRDTPVESRVPWPPSGKGGDSNTSRPQRWFVLAATVEADD